MSDGLHQKFVVERVDGRDALGGDKADAAYFVLDYAHDEVAAFALKSYADRTWRENPELAEDLWRELRERGCQRWEFKTIPEEAAETEAIRRQVVARLTELYGPDEHKWPKIRSGGR